ncbi:MAG: hypothetical protein FWD56_04900 [Bacteroidales bacterium]|nr:hypothetical protein [Bacteroidales bacterium]
MLKRILFFVVGMALVFSACNKDLLQTEEVYDLMIRTKSAVPGINAGFDPTALYKTLGNTTGDHVWARRPNGFPWGEQFTIYNFYLMNDTEEEFVSYCGNYGSWGIGDVLKVGPMDPVLQADIVCVLNYINNKWGSVDQWSGRGGGSIGNPDPAQNTKLIAQVAIWYIIEPGFEAWLQNWDVPVTDVAAIDEAVQDALINGKTTTGDIDIYFMVGLDFPKDMDGVQPQIVPYIKFQTPIVEKLMMSNLNWNNGNTSNKDGANGAGLNQFTVNGVTFKNNKEYVTPQNFETNLLKTVLGKNENPNMYTVTQRTTLSPPSTNTYEKVYDVKVAFFKNGVWEVYVGSITVDNPGGNDKNQQIELVRVQ